MSEEPSANEHDERRLAKRVLLIGWDAADWKMIDQLIDQGQMPAMKRFVTEGVRGNIASLTPMLSPILWTSIATGKHADKHQILGFAEPDGSTDKVRPVTSTSRGCKAIWNILSEHGMKAGVINWFASHPAEPINGFIVTDHFPRAVGPPPPEGEWPKIPTSVHPVELLDDLCDLRVHPASTTPQQVAPFIASLSEIDPQKDEKLSELRMLLAHCATIHSAATFLMEDQEWDFLGIYYDAIDRFGHAFMEFHPPQMKHISDEDFKRYREVMVSCYRFHDMMLARLMELAGEDTTVIIVSDHGFHSDHLRPEGSSAIKDGQPVAWHRPYGVFAIHGPNIKAGQQIYGASLLDITPTILTMLGLPVAEDMDGHAQVQIFNVEQGEAVEGETDDAATVEGEPFPGVQVETIPTYEPPEVDPSDVSSEGASDTTGGGGTSGGEDPWVAQQMLEQLRGLGYLADDGAEGTAGVVIDRLRNLGQVYSATGRPRLALEQFQEVLERKPDDDGAKMAIASAHMQLGELDACEALAGEVLSKDADGPQANLYLGMIAFRRGDDKKAMKLLHRAEAANPRLTGLQVQIGQVYLRRKRFEDAERAFNKALETDSDNAEAYDGLGVVCRALKRPEEAVNYHMQSIALLHQRPQTHINLGLALAEAGSIEWAINAFHVAIDMAPNHPLPHFCLAQLYARNNWDEEGQEKAKYHRQKGEELRAALRSTDDDAEGQPVDEEAAPATGD